MFKRAILFLVPLMMTACMNIDSSDNMQNLLFQAAKQNDVDTLKTLLNKPLNLNTKDESGATALMLATRSNHIHAAQVLINAGADVNAKDKIQDSPYLYAGARGHNEILEMTLAHHADLKSINRYGGTALIPAAERGHVQTVKMLIAAGVDVDHVNRLGWTALLEAVILGNGSQAYLDITELLLTAGANPNLADLNGVTPLAHAQARGYDKIAQALIAAGGKS